MNDWLKNEFAHTHNEFDYSIDATLFLTTIKEKYVRMYEKFIVELTLYQIETVPVPILDANNKVQSYTQLKIEKPYIALDDVILKLKVISC